MLKLSNIRKDYEAGDTVVHALKGVDLEFRENEFVAILGHSGCGKTTMLNIIGGLDHYTDGDLIINNKSTKRFTDAERVRDNISLLVFIKLCAHYLLTIFFPKLNIFLYIPVISAVVAESSSPYEQSYCCCCRC